MRIDVKKQLHIHIYSSKLPILCIGAQKRAINLNICQLNRCIFAAKRFTTIKCDCKNLETFRAKNWIGNLFSTLLRPWFARASGTASSRRITLMCALPISIRLDLFVLGHIWGIETCAWNEVESRVGCQFVYRCPLSAGPHSPLPSSRQLFLAFDAVGHN